MKLGDKIIRVSTTAAVLVVAAVAAFVSFRHAVAVIEHWGAESHLTARLIPITADGLMATSSMVLLFCARYRLRVPRLARLALTLGIAATIATNALHGLSRGSLAAVIAAWPAIALVISYELLMWVVKSGRELADVGQHSPGLSSEPNKISVGPEPLLTDFESDQINGSVPRFADDGDQQSHSVELRVAPDMSRIQPKADTANGHVEPVDMSESDRIAVVRSFLSDEPGLSGAEIGRRFGRDDEAGAKWGVRLKAKALASMNGKATSRLDYEP